MGLRFTHCTASWSYSGFNRFRRRLAAEIGIDLDKMEGFHGTRSWDNVTDPIKPFLLHSDCEGFLTPEECAIIAPRLAALTEGWGKGDYDRQNACDLVYGMVNASENNERLYFE